MVIKSEFSDYQYCMSNDSVDIENDEFELAISNEKVVSCNLISIVIKASKRKLQFEVLKDANANIQSR